jgi:hypothetical protein
MPVKTLLSAIKSPELKAVARHWSDARGARRMPAWTDIRPAAIAGQLPFVWAYTYDAASDSFTGRLAGDRIEAIFGKSFRQTPLAEIFPAGEYADVLARARRVVAEPAIFRGEGLIFRQLNRHGTGERIMLPLAADGIHGDGILGCTEYHAVEGPGDALLPETSQWLTL